MRNCKFCGSPLQDDVRFCGNCGNPTYSRTDEVTAIVSSKEPEVLEADTPPIAGALSYATDANTDATRVISPSSTQKRSLHVPHYLRRLLVAAVAFLVIIAAVIAVLLIALQPALSLNGNNSIAQGGMLRLHGKNFIPGDIVTLTLDNGLPLTYTGHRATAETMPWTTREAALASASLSLANARSELPTASNTTVTANGTGSFDLTINVSPSWSVGLHAIHAKENITARVASLPFRVILAPALIIQQTHLLAGSSDCPAITGSGNLIVGWLCSITLVTGAGDLNWSVSSTNPSDEFTPSKGVVHMNHPESVTVFIPNVQKCSNATFTFTGPANTVSVSWSCLAG